MSVYQVSGRTAATTATANNASFGLWNPHATQRLMVTEIGFFATAAPTAGASLALRRTTARGTTTSVTPGIAQDLDRGATPPSGALLDISYSVQPTLETVALFDYVFAAVAASGMIYPFPNGIKIPPGAGLVLVNAAAIIVPINAVWFRWDE